MTICGRGGWGFVFAGDGWTADKVDTRAFKIITVTFMTNFSGKMAVDIKRFRCVFDNGHMDYASLPIFYEFFSWTSGPK